MAAQFAGVMSTILRARGLPFAATVDDLHAFFSPEPVKAVYLGTRNGCDNPALPSAPPCAAGPPACRPAQHWQGSLAAVDGRHLAPKFCRKPTGECYTEFETAEAAAKALKEKQHEHMGSRYIE